MHSPSGAIIANLGLPAEAEEKVNYYEIETNLSVERVFIYSVDLRCSISAEAYTLQSVAATNNFLHKPHYHSHSNVTYYRNLAAP